MNDVTNISDFLSSVLFSFTWWHRKRSGKDRAVRSNTAPCWQNPAEGRSLRLSSAVMGKTSHTVLMTQGTKRGFSYKCSCLLEKLMSTGTAVQHHWEESLNLLAKSGFSRTVGAGFMQICFPCSLHKFHISSTFSVVKYEYECSLAYCTHSIIKEYSHVCSLNTLCLFVGHFKIKSTSSSHLTPHNQLIFFRLFTDATQIFTFILGIFYTHDYFHKCTWTHQGWKHI